MDEPVTLASRDITRPAPVDRKGKRVVPDRNRLVSAARVAVDLKAFFYRDNGARSRTTEEVPFPEHDLVLLPYASLHSRSDAAGTGPPVVLLTKQVRQDLLGDATTFTRLGLDHDPSPTQRLGRSSADDDWS